MIFSVFVKKNRSRWSVEQLLAEGGKLDVVDDMHREDNCMSNATPEPCILNVKMGRVCITKMSIYP
ncbi:hypothetical protein YQ44_14175 [Janthinobacterium sp. 1_2014MBL_MicDiv]|nr:hypothetical protein YQ44_14175 [Janthinobacterium sp. 1_2014MBL_MicDiv]